MPRLPWDGMEGSSILAVLARHPSLPYAEIAAQVSAEPDQVRVELAHLRDLGLVAALTVGELVANRTDAASFWSITARGRAALASKRAGAAGTDSSRDE